MSVLRSIGAVLAGFVVVFVLSSAMDFVVESAGLLPPPTRVSDYTNVHWAVALAYRSVITVLGAYITARLAPNRAMTHALVLGALGTLAGLAGVYAAIYLMSLPAGALWYPIALPLTAIPLCWLGAKLHRPRAGA